MTVLNISPSRPDLIDMEVVTHQSNRDNLEQAFEIAESLGVTRLLDAEGEAVFLAHLPDCMVGGLIYGCTGTRMGSVVG